MVESPGHWTVLQGSCCSASPEQLEPPRGGAARVALQRRQRRLHPTWFTWWKHVLLHSDQLVHLLHGPSAESGGMGGSVCGKQVGLGLGGVPYRGCRVGSSGGPRKRPLDRAGLAPPGSQETCRKNHEVISRAASGPSKGEEHQAAPVALLQPQATGDPTGRPGGPGRPPTGGRAAGGVTAGSSIPAHTEGGASVM